MGTHNGKLFSCRKKIQTPLRSALLLVTGSEPGYKSISCSQGLPAGHRVAVSRNARELPMAVRRKKKRSHRQHQLQKDRVPKLEVGSCQESPGSGQWNLLHSALLIPFTLNGHCYYFWEIIHFCVYSLTFSPRFAKADWKDLKCHLVRALDKLVILRLWGGGAGEDNPKQQCRKQLLLLPRLQRPWENYRGEKKAATRVSLILAQS